MKLFRGVVILTVAFLASATLRANATVYTDVVGDQGAGNSDGIMDITSVEVTAGANDLSFKINLNGDPTAVNWGKYCVGISTGPGGDTVGDGWARPIGMNASGNGMNYWLGSWCDSGGGAELRPYTGSWGLQDATYGANPDALTETIGTSYVTLDFKYAGIGLAPGSSFLFDVYTTGGGSSDTAIDALDNPGVTVANWSDNYNSGNSLNSFTIPVPEPSTWVLVAFGGLTLVGRIFRRRA